MQAKTPFESVDLPPEEWLPAAHEAPMPPAGHQPQRLQRLSMDEPPPSVQEKGRGEKVGRGGAGRGGAGRGGADGWTVFGVHKCARMGV